LGFPIRHGGLRRSLGYLGVTALVASGFALVAVSPVAADQADITFSTPASVSTDEPAIAPENAPVGGFTDLDNIGLTSPTRQATVCGDPSVYTAKIDWGDGTTPTDGTVSCNTDTNLDAEYAVNSPDGHTYKDSGTFTVTLSVTDNAGNDTGDTDSGPTVDVTINDATLTATSATNLRGGGEGGTVEPATVGASAFFADSNQVFADAETVDPSLKATINWGDGTTSAATSITWPDCGECGNVEVSGSHVYDANIPATKKYSVTITLQDDGGKSATSEAGNTPAISDAALTADANKSVSATATQAFTAVVASFKDAAGAQAATADFTASINWGDNSSSSGTVTKTASGAFSVSGSHTYASAGSKSLTITATDEEGSTVTMHATATVAAAPIVLPATGQPHQPASAWPVGLLALLLLGLVAMAGGVARVVLKRSSAR
jgi:hypothetical protein